MSNKLPDKSAISERAVAKLAAGSHIAAIVPTTIEEVFRLAELIHQSGLAPYQLKSPAAVTVVLLKGLEIGVPPMAALETIGVINGKACLHSDGIPALLWSRGFKIKEHYENEANLDQCVAVCTITRPEGDEYTFRYSSQDAKDNGLWDARDKIDGKANRSPWFLFKKRMLKMRARGWLARDCASDVLKGIPIYEEQADIELGRSDYREVKGAPLPVPTDIEDGTVTEPVTATVTEAESSQDAPFPNPEKYIGHLGEELAASESREQFDEIWVAHQETETRLPQEYRDKATALHDEQVKRFEKAAKKAPKN